MACLQALQITEIVRMICDEARSPYSLAQPSLFSLATTSKIFSDPALDCIWREPRSLVPLVKCMPDTLWEERRVGSNVVIRLRRPIAVSDIPRLLFYSVRVRNLDMDGSHRATLHNEVLRALDMSMPPQPFMPKLYRFDWSPTKNAAVTIMRHFMGPQIREINLDLGENVANLSILPFIKSSCPLVSDFTLELRTDRHSIPLISEAVCGWQRLIHLSVPNLDMAGFIHVAQLPSLISLSLCSQEDTTIHPPEFLSGPSFPTLKSLDIRCQTARFCTGIIRVISSRQFETLTIRLLASWTTSAWQTVHTALRDCLNHKTLDSIDVEGALPPPGDTALYGLSADTLRPLLAFKRLTSISYPIYPTLDVDDDFLEEMAMSWPRMRSLSFVNEAYQPQPPRATLKCLIGFARHCSRLSDLGLRMDATNVPEFIQLPGDRIGTPLESLNVGASPINSRKEADVAAFISNLFPRVEYLFTLATPPEVFETQAKSWDRVLDMLPVFSSVRSQEEEFWTTEVVESDEESTDDVEETS